MYTKLDTIQIKDTHCFNRRGILRISMDAAKESEDFHPFDVRAVVIEKVEMLGREVLYTVGIYGRRFSDQCIKLRD